MISTFCATPLRPTCCGTPDPAIDTSLKALVDIKDRIKGLAERSDIAVK